MRQAKRSVPWTITAVSVDHYENFPVASWLCPPALRPPLWREMGLIACSAFYAFFTWFVVRDLLRSLW